MLSELLIDGNERLIVIGSLQEDNITGHFALQRFTTVGTLDNTFGVNGTTQTYFGGNSAFCHGANLQPDGKIIAVGKIYDGGDIKQVTVRYLSNGTIDSNFGTSGYVITDYLADAEATCVKVYDNKIYVGGYKLGTTNAPGTRMTVVRMNMDGTLDGTFSNDGIWIGPTWISGGGYARDIIVQPDGNILVVGVESIQFGGLGTRLYRLTNNGGWDNSFVGGGGVDYTDDIVTPRAAQLASDGKILLTGSFDSGLCVSRLLANGAIDQTWGSNGTACYFDGNYGLAQDIAIQSNSSILLAGIGSGGFLLCRLFGGNVGIAGISGPASGVSAYPNPIVESVTLSYTLAETEELTIALHDLQGRVLATYLNGKDMPAGEHTQTITMPSDLASGNYLLVFSSSKGRMSVQVSK